MRGRRKGRNKSSSKEGKDSLSASEADAVGGGSVKLVVPTAPSQVREGDSSADPSSVEASSDDESRRAPTPLHSTVADVHSAHAELNDVLSPDGGAAVAQRIRTEEADVSDGAGVETANAATNGVTTIDAPTSVSEAAAEAPPDRDSGPTLAAKRTATSDSQGAISSAAAPDEGRIAQAASGNALPRVLAVANQKGGVGKTTTSVNLGAALAELGFRVLVVDLDPQGNATTGLGIDARNFELSMYDVLMRDASLEDCVEPTSMKNLFVAPATIALAGAEIELVPAFSRELKLKRAIESVIDDFDYVLIDCPPSLGLITVNALAAAGEVLVPIQCEYYALEGLSQLMRNVHLVASNLNPKLDISTIVLTMYDARTKLADQVANEVRLHFGTKVCRIVIPRTVRLSEAPSFGQPITAFDPASRGAIAYRELAKEVSGGTT